MPTKIYTKNDLLLVLEQFQDEYTHLEPNDMHNPKVLGELFARHHAQIAEYVSQSDYINILQAWSSMEYDPEEGKNYDKGIDALLAQGFTVEQATMLGLLWAVNLNEETEEAFAEGLFQLELDKQYNKECLPQSLSAYIFVDPEIEIV